jgi:DivIVA domain-containing protein
MRKKKLEQELEQQETAGAALEGSPRLTPMDVQQKEFRLAFRGYNERDVDAFLDQITEEFALYVEENRRLRDSSGAATTVALPPSQGGSGTADPSREADTLVARAREEAARIVREAETKAAAATGSPSSAGDHGAVAPFLNKEREFLQSLASLVQGHAENVKVMVKAHRERTSSPATPQPSPVRVPEPTEAPKAAAEAATTSLASESSSDAVLPSTDVATGASSDRPARSLRELFWGED